MPTPKCCTYGRTEEFADDDSFTMAGPKNLPCDMIEPVNADGSRYLLEMAQAASFARHFQLSDAKNFPRAIDPSEQRYHFCNHWQGTFLV